MALGSTVDRLGLATRSDTTQFHMKVPAQSEMELNNKAELMAGKQCNWPAPQSLFRSLLIESPWVESFRMGR